MTYAYDGEQFSKWAVETDVTILGAQQRDGNVDGYGSVAIEVKSPATWFSGDALKEVGFVAGLLTSKYVLAVNETMGLHCHVGNGVESFEFDTMRKLIAFLWGFEPQLNSLHPQSRFNREWAGSLRYSSYYAQRTFRTRGSRPRALEGVAHFLTLKDWRALSEDTMGSVCGRLSVRWAGIAAKAIQGFVDEGGKKTVEFRQHIGSVDGEDIKNWIRTCVGIVGFILDTDILKLKMLFEILQHEVPEDLDGATGEPVLAETEFTIIDLLRTMELYIPALYYRQKGIYKVRKELQPGREQ